jgi:hypothetical protein
VQNVAQGGKSCGNGRPKYSRCSRVQDGLDHPPPGLSVRIARARPAVLAGRFHKYRCSTVEFCLTSAGSLFVGRALFIIPTEIGFRLEGNPGSLNYFNVVDVEFYPVKSGRT